MDVALPFHVQTANSRNCFINTNTVSVCLHQAINMMKDEVRNFGLMVQVNCLQQARMQETRSLEKCLLAIYYILNTKNRLQITLAGLFIVRKC